MVFCLAFLEDLGLTQNQRYDLKLLLHVLYSNPKVLYSPNNTQADQVIEKVWDRKYTRT